jgi:hypothetical protein
MLDGLYAGSTFQVTLTYKNRHNHTFSAEKSSNQASHCLLDMQLSKQERGDFDFKHCLAGGRLQDNCVPAAAAWLQRCAAAHDLLGPQPGAQVLDKGLHR